MKISRDVIGAFSEASMELLLQEPFHAHLLARLHIVYTSEIDTACVRISPSGIQLGINPDFFLNECQPRQRVALLKHELLHVIFGHLAFKVDEDFPPILANLAADIVVNQYVGRWPLPDGAIRLETFSKLKLCSHQSIDYYYQALTELFTEMSNRTIIVGGVLIPNPKRKFDPRIFPILEEIIRKHGEFSNSRWQSEYSSSLNPSETNQAFREFQDFIKKLLMDNPNLAHSLPNFVVRQLEETPRAGKKINWKVALRNFKNQSQLRRLCFTMKKPSKRYGTVPGPKIRRKCKLVVAVDTSGSISGEVLAMFSNEIQAIHRAGASVTIVECDSDVRRSYPFHGKKLDTFNGKGGTCFDPVFSWIGENGHFDGCIYLTDGYGPVPTKKPGCRVLWVICPGGTDESVSQSFGTIGTMK